MIDFTHCRIVPGIHQGTLRSGPGGTVPPGPLFYHVVHEEPSLPVHYHVVHKEPSLPVQSSRSARGAEERG